jgi:hypothetical protein
MHRLRAGRARRADDGLNGEVALGRGGRADEHCVVGNGRVESLRIRLGVHGDGFDAHLAAGANHSHCNLTAIRYQDSREHTCSS